jgi:hypothetical protein
MPTGPAEAGLQAGLDEPAEEHRLEQAHGQGQHGQRHPLRGLGQVVSPEGQAELEGPEDHPQRCRAAQVRACEPEIGQGAAPDPDRVHDRPHDAEEHAGGEAREQTGDPGLGEHPEGQEEQPDNADVQPTDDGEVLTVHGARSAGQHARDRCSQGQRG